MRMFAAKRVADACNELNVQVGDDGDVSFGRLMKTKNKYV
jgi:hypothetical protein